MRTINGQMPVAITVDKHNANCCSDYCSFLRREDNPRVGYCKLCDQIIETSFSQRFNRDMFPRCDKCLTYIGK